MQDSRANLQPTTCRRVYNLSCNICTDKRKETRTRHAEASQCISELCLRLPVHYSATLDLPFPRLDLPFAPVVNLDWHNLCMIDS